MNPKESLKTGKDKGTLASLLRRRIRYTTRDQAIKQLSVQQFRQLFNQYFDFYDEWHEKFPNERFMPTLTMLAFYIGFSSQKLMMDYLRNVVTDERVHKLVTEDEVRAVFAIFHEMHASSPEMSKKWLQRHYPMEWAERPDMSRIQDKISANMGEDGEIKLTIVRDYRGPD